MTDKELIFDEDARKFLKKGVQELAAIVRVTLGPIGRNIGVDTSFGAPQITNDGNSIIKDIELKNQYENMGASIGKEVAAKMKEKCGDGTTTSIVLLSSLVEEGVKHIASGASPIFVKRGIEKAVEAIVLQLEKGARKIKDDTEIKEIAASSASGSQEVGSFIADAFSKVGKSGVISIEESKTIHTSLELVEGMQFDRGYASPYFCTDTEKMLCTLTNPLILITDKKISSAQEILPILQEVASRGQELLIIAEDIEKEALSTLVVNRIRKTLKVAAVKAPGFGDQRKALLQDIATLTNATLITEDAGLLLKDADSTLLGGADRVLITKESTTVVNGKGTHQAIQERIIHISNEAARATESYEIEKLHKRRAKLSGGVALICVGAATEFEMKQKKQLFEDSLNSTRAAIEEGLVTGGGVALFRSAQTAQKEFKSAHKEEKLGAGAVFKACRAPFLQLVSNSGYDGLLYSEEIMKQNEHFGFNVINGKIEDLFVAGVRDPLKIIKNGLKFAASAAGMILLSECLIGESPEDDIDK